MANDWNESTLAGSRLLPPRQMAVQPLAAQPAAARPAAIAEGLYQQRLAVAAHLHLLLRRKLGRVTDIEWMARNEDYARAMVQLALADPAHAELVAMGQRLQALVPTAPSLVAVAPPPAAPVLRYVRSLR